MTDRRTLTLVVLGLTLSTVGIHAEDRSRCRDFQAISSRRLEAPALTANAQALELDEREAPQREIARQRKEADDSRAAQETSRLAKKAADRP